MGFSSGMVDDIDDNEKQKNFFIFKKVCTHTKGRDVSYCLLVMVLSVYIDTNITEKTLNSDNNII